MAKEFVLKNEIWKDHYERMLNLRKFFPFFQLSASGFRNYGDGSFVSVDMAYMILATLGFFVHEDSISCEEVTYEKVVRFIVSIIDRDYCELFKAYGPKEQAEEEKKLASWFFDKLQNGGKAFEMNFYEPESRTNRMAGVRLIESEVRASDVIYHITEDGIEFYLSTKEVRDESRITTEQLLLEKLIRAENFAGSMDVIQRINVEVQSLIHRCAEIKHLLLADIHSGTQAVDLFMEDTSKWFGEEKKSFERNRELLDKAVLKVSGGEAGSAIKDVIHLEHLLQEAIENHSSLITKAAELSEFTNEMVKRNRRESLRSVYSFTGALLRMQKKDSADDMGYIIKPFFMPKKYKSFGIEVIDNVVLDHRDSEEKTEIREREKTDFDFEYPDEKLSRTVGQNFAKLFLEILGRFEKWEKFNLSELNAILEIRYGENIYLNRDYFSFFTQLAGKNDYSVEKMILKPETFLERMVTEYGSEELDKYKNFVFHIEYSDDIIKLPMQMTFAEAHNVHEGKEKQDDIEENQFISNMIFTIKQTHL